MSLEAMVWALNCDSAPDPLAKLVLIGLANHADSIGCAAWPAQETLAAYASCSVRSVRRKIAELEDCGLIARGDQRIVAHLRGDRRPVVWDLVTDGLFTPPVTRSRQDTGVRPDSLSPRNDRTTTTPRQDTAGRQTVLEPNTPLPPVSGCSRHSTQDGRCRACRSVQDAKAKTEARKREAAERIEHNRIAQAEVDRCGMCDEYGYIAGHLCDHDPATPIRARSGADRVRQAMGWGKDKGAEKREGGESTNTPPYAPTHDSPANTPGNTPANTPARHRGMVRQ